MAMWRPQITQWFHCKHYSIIFSARYAPAFSGLGALDLDASRNVLPLVQQMVLFDIKVLIT